MIKAFILIGTGARAGGRTVPPGYTMTTGIFPTASGGFGNAGLGNYGFGGGIPPKIRAIFIPQGGFQMMGASN